MPLRLPVHLPPRDNVRQSFPPRLLFPPLTQAVVQVRRGRGGAVCHPNDDSLHVLHDLPVQTYRLLEGLLREEVFERVGVLDCIWRVEHDKRRDDLVGGSESAIPYR